MANLLCARLGRVLVLIVLALALGACDTLLTAIENDRLGAEVERLTVEVISDRPHDPNAFTQGLLLYEGSFYESTGRYGQSSLREVNPETGEVIRIVNIAPEFFAEGLALVEDYLYQLTWVNGYAFVFDRASFEFLGAFTYDTEGWGLCYDGERLWMSDGSSTLYVRDPESFTLLEEVPVTLFHLPLRALNELECVGDVIYANVWQTNTIVRIDKATGAVTGVIDASGLLTEEENAMVIPQGGVLNGIAYDAEQEVFYITGKLWPRLFEVRFVPGESAG